MCRFIPMLLVLLLATPCLVLKSASVEARRGSIELATYPWWPSLKHPYFRATDGRNIYPYRMMDNLSRTQETRRYATVVLENEFLRLTFLPEIGGRVYEVLDKTTGTPMFYVNRVMKPGLIGQCGAWVSGGIEFNTGPAGHTVSAMLPVDVEILPPASDGSRSVAVGEVERIYGTRWTVVVTLRPGRSFLEETIRIYNQSDVPRPYYFWNCTAVPNTPGFQFVYPMTLGTDHGGTQFYRWPISDGKDLSKGTNYQDASSIFAYGCDQDFFGSYDTLAERGVVAFANHHQVPGKKAWTWGHGSYGTMHQMDLTDEDGPYNEVQTGPLLTQADVGRLDPLEAVTWQEWWYPVRNLGGFVFANRDLAVNAETEGDLLRLRAMGSGSWDGVRVTVTQGKDVVATATCRVSPRRAADLSLNLGGAREPLAVEWRSGPTVLARFQVPLDLPERTPPAKPAAPQTAHQRVKAGWQDYLFARFKDAEQQFEEARRMDPSFAAAMSGLSYLLLDSHPEKAATWARSAVALDDSLGTAWFALAVAACRQGDNATAREAAWQASLDPSVAVAARAMAARIEAREGNWQAVVTILEEPGPWRVDPRCRDLLALAHWNCGGQTKAIGLARENLVDEPLDLIARTVLWLGRSKDGREALRRLLEARPEVVLELMAQLADVGLDSIANRVLVEFALNSGGAAGREPLVWYWAAYLASRLGNNAGAGEHLKQAATFGDDGRFPHHFELVPVLRWALSVRPDDGRAALLLGHVLFALGRHDAGREMWTKAASQGGSSVVAYRSLGMAALSLDRDHARAAEYLEQAQRLDPADAIVARDLARVLFDLAGRGSDGSQRQEQVVKARDVLQAAFSAGRGRSDFVALLARAHNRLGDYAETARLLDGVRITIWEGAHEAHDLFEQAHLALGKEHWAAGRAESALAEFNRALEYPENLATGRLESAREAHIHVLRGEALMALGRRQEALQAWKRAVDEPPLQDANSAHEKARAAAAAALSRHQEAP